MTDKFRRATPDEILDAQRLFSDEEADCAVSIDADAEATDADDGAVWVRAWVRLPAEEQS